MKSKGIYISPSEFVAFAEPRQRGLSDHIATRDRSPDFSALGMLLPNPDPILKKQGRDISIYRELRSDAHVGGCVRRRKAAVTALEWRVVRDKAGARTTRLVEDVLGRLDLDTLINEIEEAAMYGWQPLEIIWGQRGGANVPMTVQAKPPEWFMFDTAAQLRFRSREQPLFGEELEARKFLLATQDASYANPYGQADLSMCFWPTVFKRGGLRFWVTFTEKFGTPWLVGKTPRGTGDRETNKLLDQLEAMIQDAVAVIPDDSSVDIVESAGRGTSADLYERLLMFCRSEISIALLGQNQSTEASATNASAMAGLEVARTLRDGDAKMTARAINTLIRWVVDLNDGEQAPAPRFELYEEEAVNTEQAERDQLLQQSGVRFTRAYWKRAYDLEDGDLEPDQPPAPTVPAVPQGLVPSIAQAAFAESGPRDAIDDLVNAELQGWRPLVEPFRQQLQQLLDQAAAQGSTAEEVLARLPSLIEGDNADALALGLTRAAIATRLAGEAGIDPIGDADAAVEQAAGLAFAEPAQPELHVHVNVTNSMPEQAPPKVDVQVTNQVPEPRVDVQITNQVPAQPAPTVEVTVQPATQEPPVVNVPAPQVTVLDSHPSRAVQTVERDEHDEILRTVTVYERTPKDSLS